MIFHSLTLSVLPSGVPGQTEKRGEEDEGSGNSSISEPHLISAAVRGPRGSSPPALLLLLQRSPELQRFKYLPGPSQAIIFIPNASSQKLTYYSN